MLPYSNHTKSALTAEIRDLQHLLRLIDNMEKPSNFTYVDVVNLYKHLEELQNYLQVVLILISSQCCKCY